MLLYFFGTIKRSIWSIIWIIIILYLLSGLYNKFFTTWTSNEVVTYSVATGDISISVRVSGSAGLVNEQKLSFAKEEKIKKVTVKDGDQVKAGDILAELNLDAYQNSLNSAELDLSNATLALKKLESNDTTLVQAQLRNKIDDLQKNSVIEKDRYDILVSQLNNTSNQKKQQLKELDNKILITQDNLTIASSWLALTIWTETEQTAASIKLYEETITQTLHDIDIYLTSFTDAVEDIDKIYSVTDTFRSVNISINSYLSAKNSVLKNTLPSDVLDAYSYLDTLKVKLESIKKNWNIEATIWKYLTDLYSWSVIFIDLMDNATQGLDDSLTSASFTSTQLEWFKSIVSKHKSQIVTNRTSMLWTRTKLDNFISTYLQEWQLETSISKEKLDFKELELSLATLKNQKNLLENEIRSLLLDQENQLSKQLQQIDSLKNSISLTQIELQDVIDGADSNDVQTQRNRIRQAELALEKIIDQKQDFQIIADFDWRVRSVDISEGEQFKFDDRKYIIVENPNLIELELLINQIDIVKVKKWDAVDITFDAYPNRPISSQVDNINVTPIKNERGWTSYKVTVIIEKQDLHIFAWMTALATITSEKREWVILVPSLAVKIENWQHVVYKKNKNDTFDTITVEIWISDNFNTEIVRWLGLWDIIAASLLTQEDFDTMWITAQWDSIFGGE